MARRVLDLRRGHPSPACLPHQMLAKATAAASARMESGKFPLSYAPPEGSKRFRTHLASFLNRQDTNASHAPARPDSLMLTTGVSHGVDLVCRTMTQRGDIALVEDATYFLVAPIFENHGLRVDCVATDNDGIDVAALESRLQRGERPTLLYTIPVHSNPRAATLSSARREKLCQLARKFGFHIVADEVYHLLDWTEPAQTRPPRMVSFDPAFRALAPSASGEAKGGEGEEEEEAEEEDGSYLDALGVPGEKQELGCVISVSAFSKIVAPGVRVGWVEACPGVIARMCALGYVVSGGGVAGLASEILTEAMAARGTDQFLTELCGDMQRRATVLTDALTSHGLTPQCVPRGGYFLWCDLGEGVNAREVLKVAEEEFDVAFLCGDKCDPVHGQFTTCIRLCFAFLSEAELTEAAQRVAQAVAAVKRRNNHTN